MPTQEHGAARGARPNGVILAGGASRRMGRDKRLATLAQCALLAHVIHRLASQVEQMVLSVDRATQDLRPFGLTLVTDPQPGHRGPLGGLLAALRHFENPEGWLLLAPCDAPFLPVDLASRLMQCAEQAGVPVAVAVDDGEWQPTFALWHGSLLPEVEQAVLGAGEGGFRRLLKRLGAVPCSWPDHGDAPSPFFNVNDPAALARAEEWLHTAVDGRVPCSV